MNKKNDKTVVGSIPTSKKNKTASKTTKKNTTKSSTSKLKEQIEQLEKKLLLNAADFDNYRKRIGKELEKTRQQTKLDAIHQMLSVYDMFKMAVQESNKENVNLDIIKQGILLIKDNFTKLLEQYMVTEIHSIGKSFDHNLHTAISEEIDDSKETGTIIKEYSCGYKMGDKVIRTANVVVSKKKD